MDKRSFVGARMHMLMKDTVKFIKEIPEENGISIAANDNRWNLGPVFDLLSNDQDMRDRYDMTFDMDANRIKLTFKKYDYNNVSHRSLKAGEARFLSGK